MSEESDNLTPKQNRAVLALIERGNIERAAEDVKICARTLHRWLKQPAFRAAYTDAGQRAFEDGLVQVQRLTTLAAITVAQVLLDKGTSTGAKLRAAHLVLQHAQPTAELELRMKMRPKDGFGVLMVAGPVTTEQWVELYGGIEQYQQTLGKQGADSDTQKAKPQAEKTNTA